MDRFVSRQLQMEHLLKVLKVCAVNGVMHQVARLLAWNVLDIKAPDRLNRPFKGLD